MNDPFMRFFKKALTLSDYLRNAKHLIPAELGAAAETGHRTGFHWNGNAESAARAIE